MFRHIVTSNTLIHGIKIRIAYDQTILYYGYALYQSVPKTLLLTRQNQISPIIQASAHWNVQALLLVQMELG